MAKQYGLIIPNKDKSHKIGQVSLAKPSIFDEDSDSDSPKTSVTVGPKNLKKRDKLIQEKAAQEDPTVFQYDEVYDEIEQKRKESKLARKDLDRKPKYINRLLAAADKRKRENERRIERQVQKEREEEGDMYKDKESFITSAYKKKLEEMKELEEQEQREEYLESIGDVRKQGNLDGFYRHLYDQKLNFEKKEDNDKAQPVEVKEEPLDGEEESTKLQDTISESQSDDEDRVKWKRDGKKRKYRKHKDSDEEEPEVKKEHLPSNLDADSDFSIDSSDSEDENNKERHKKTKQDETQKIDELIVNASIQTEKEGNSEEKTEVKEDDKMKMEIEVKAQKPKIDIWKKRTVGEKFDEAVKRYFERKAMREMGQ